MKSYSNDSEIKASIKKNVKDHGCHISLIKSDGYNPSFGYTVGLTKQYNHPEIIVLGLDVESTHAILNSAFLDIKEGTKFITEIGYNGFLDGFEIQFVNVSGEYYSDYLGYAGWFNENSWNFKALQMVWPDKQSHFPWDSDFVEELKFRQPLLDRNLDFKFLELRSLSVFTTEDVLNGSTVTNVFHDEKGNWLFYSENGNDTNSTKIVRLEDLVKDDITLNHIYFLNYGESAFRKDKLSDWIIDSHPIRKVISDTLNNDNES
ncbi:DUF4262 domain-containing protein [Flavivirga amylovorans]|uniref:DUF4262 domain-containing protein n=1 Tax=Flavivirga amylovorans TaxID=870486 RepID=A0ABT8X1E4_9FLAO|nr:DUF4262 domain-containing protein [Flavivirga amylovorans]MDO5987741.1 DUF4262 domain-containing protein [Flavivirga amylovorans]